jgi:hypothetical protein
LRYRRGRIGSDAEDVASAAWLDAARGLPQFAGHDAANGGRGVHAGHDRKP